MATSEPSAEPSLHAEERGESSLDFCEICRERKENEQLIKNENCGHPFCLECISKRVEENIELGLKTVECPGLNCECVLQLEAFKHLISKDVLSLREKSPSLEVVPNSTCRGQEKVADDVEKLGTAFSDDADDDSDSDAWPDTDAYDSEASPRSPKSCKKSKWFKKFLKGFDYMSTEEINDPARQWHCSACQGAAGAIKRYLSLKTLVKHAKSKGSRRVRLHRELAQLLEEKLHGGQASSAALGGEACGNWKGLKEEKKYQEIVWPPMVVITNTIHKKDENNKWTGMTTQQLPDLFSSYNTIVKAQHFYNSDGQCRMSILSFESSARGCLEADWLHRHFAEEEAGRNAWNNRPVYFLPSGEHQLYGYMAVKEDVDTFNQHYLKGKRKLKYEMRSYKEMMVDGIRQMSRENLQLPWLQNRIAEQQSHAKDLEKSNGMLKEKLNKATKDLEILRLKAKQQHEQDLEEVTLSFHMQFLEQL
ncbi:hypothetical protein MANES_04G095100v8 [Manihot esculenta]|uniref:Uncharacterized protein n=6 Tax=Manihot esculenta TaxID=3983 RepID=A0ACB7HVC6_MANES|nr:hypothetical protein MANES_04G095100v8 [Manihot esculenta]KAG8656074.1 hypothetical protein MANES_04G095100v8 [Manihot esculenta]KAG8656075.1 hypothetical protein MANES_04G095100v8 [Manihot esculenta]KAG8656076.1 hypothetical protein MANES_04G095100v8 [Manihot esculenta]KAG8656077.1 hypothetical protein MANES_04G095100v8 [Manihot esculenta]